MSILRLEYKTYMGIIWYSIVVSTVITSLILFPLFLTCISLPFKYELILWIFAFSIYPSLMFYNRKRLPVYSLDLITLDFKTTTHSQIISFLKNSYSGRMEHLLMSKKVFDQKYPKSEFETFNFSLKNCDKNLLSCKGDWKITDYYYPIPIKGIRLGIYKDFFPPKGVSTDEYISKYYELTWIQPPTSYALYYNNQFISPLSYFMAIYLHIRGFIKLGFWDYLGFFIFYILVLTLLLIALWIII